MRLDLLLHPAPNPSLQVASELRTLIDPNRSEPGCDGELPAAKKPVRKHEDTRREKRAKLDVVVSVLGLGH